MRRQQGYGAIMAITGSAAPPSPLKRVMEWVGWWRG